MTKVNREQARQIIATVAAGNLSKDASKNQFLDSRDFHNLVVKAAHLREDVLDYSSKQTQDYIDTLRDTSLKQFLSIGERIAVAFTEFVQWIKVGSPKEKRYEKVAEKIINYAAERLQKRELSSQEITAFFESAVKEKNPELRTEKIRRLLEAEELDQEKIITVLFPKLYTRTPSPLRDLSQEQINGIFEAAVASGKEKVINKFLEKGLVLNVPGALEVAVKNRCLHVIDILVGKIDRIKPEELLKVCQASKSVGEEQVIRKVLARIVEEFDRADELIGVTLVHAVDEGDVGVIEALFRLGVYVEKGVGNFRVTAERYKEALRAAYTKGAKVGPALLSVLTTKPLETAPDAVRTAISEVRSGSLPFVDSKLLAFLDQKISS